MKWFYTNGSTWAIRLWKGVIKQHKTIDSKSESSIVFAAKILRRQNAPNTVLGHSSTTKGSQKENQQQSIAITAMGIQSIECPLILLIKQQQHHFYCYCCLRDGSDECCCVNLKMSTHPLSRALPTPHPSMTAKKNGSIIIAVWHCI